MKRLLFAFAALLAAELEPAIAGPADDCLFIPPAITDRVVFYHSFGKGTLTPDINLIDAKLSAPENAKVQGIAGVGYMTGSGAVAKNIGPLILRSPSLSVHKPLTVMFWWRLDAPMKEETGFGVLALRGAGWISTFIAGKGPWCGLTQPTYVFQCYNFPGMENCNDIWGGRAWFESKAWHHTAITVSGAADVRIYWDGKLRTQYTPKGRLFKLGEINTLELGASGESPAMTLDEVLILDRALSEDELAAYVVPVKALSQQFSNYNNL